MRLITVLMAMLVAGAAQAAAKTETAIFAGGCFWCMESPFEKLPGVQSVVSGYIGGRTAHPTYEQVSAGGTGHAEAVQIVYDPAMVSYARLLEVFWRNIDPLAKDSQFCDHGDQYRSAIFYVGPEQKKLAEASRDALARSKRLPGTIQTQLVEASPFYAAEAYHQDYYKKNAVRYNYYRWGCGRDARLKELWGDEAGGATIGGKKP